MCRSLTSSIVYGYVLIALSQLMHTHEIRDAQSGDLEYTHVLGRVK